MKQRTYKNTKQKHTHRKSRDSGWLE